MGSIPAGGAKLKSREALNLSGFSVFIVLQTMLKNVRTIFISRTPSANETDSYQVNIVTYLICILTKYCIW